MADNAPKGPTSFATSLPFVQGFYDPGTSTLSYLVVDRAAGRGVIIDPVLELDVRNGRTSTRAMDLLIAAAEGIKIDAVIETHAHADHLSAAALLRQRLGCRIVTGHAITTVQSTWGRLLNLGSGFIADGRQFDRIMGEGDHLAVGSLDLEFWDTPGHTPSCQTIVLRGQGRTAAFVGDTLFMPDYGTARTDFPGGDAGTLYRSIRRVLALPEDSVLFMCHDYCPGGRALAWECTVADQRRGNIHVKDGVDEDAFVAMRTARDKTLSAPALLLPAIQVNIRAGEFPEPEANGVSFLKLPLNLI